MAQFIYLLKPVRLAMLVDGPTEPEADAVAAHVDYLEQLSAGGGVLLAGRTQTADDETFGIVILRADSETDAVSLMQADPAVSRGVMRAKLYPYAIAVVSDQILQ